MTWSNFLFYLVIGAQLLGANGRTIHKHHHQRRATPPPKPGFTLTWSEEFNGNAGNLPDTNTWQIDTGHSYPGGPWNWGTGEIQRYTGDSSNLRLDGKGNLNIIPRRNGGEWTSARIETHRSDFICQPGGQMIIEGSIMLPSTDRSIQSGIWPAFWALGSSYRGTFGWPMCGEWDILEVANGLNSIYGTLHCGVSPGGPCNENTGIGGGSSFTRGNFHTYSIRMDRTSSNWQEEYLAWSVDGNEYFRVTGGRVGDFNTWDNLAHKPFFILLNVAIGGGFPDALAGTRTPNDATVGGDQSMMIVDWVAVYNSNGGGGSNQQPLTSQSRTTSQTAKTSTKTTTRTTKISTTSTRTTTRTTSRSVTRSSMSRTSVPTISPTLTPANFPPGQPVQCVSVTQTNGVSFSPSQLHIDAAGQACNNLLPNGSSWVDTWSLLDALVSVSGRSLKFSIKIHIGGFTLQRAECVRQFVQVLDSCVSGNPPVSHGGCVYSSDNNFQSCILFA